MCPLYDSMWSTQYHLDSIWPKLFKLNLMMRKQLDKSTMHGIPQDTALEFSEILTHER